MFRKDALTHAGDKLHGEILLLRPVSFSVLTWLFCAIALGLLVFFFTFSFARKTNVAGVLVPVGGIVRVVAPQSGLVAQLNVQEGQEIQAGDVLLILSSERSSSMGETGANITDLLTRRKEIYGLETGYLVRQRREQIAGRHRRIEELTNDAELLRSLSQIQGQRLELARRTRAQYADLHNRGFVSVAQLTEKSAIELDEEYRMRELERELAAVHQQVSETTDELAALELQLERDQLAAEQHISVVDRDLLENETQRAIEIRAPQSGLIAAMMTTLGQPAAAGQVLCAIIDAHTPLEAELHVSSASVGFLRPGMEVTLRFRAFPYQKFGQHPGTIRDVSLVAMRPAELVETAGSETDNLLYRVRVSLERQFIVAYGEPVSLRPGMSLEAGISLESRRLYEWALEPLLGLRGRL